MAENKLSWDSEISTSEYVQLPEGDYNFTVRKLEKSWYNGGAKLPECPMAKLEIEVTDGTASVLIRHNFYLFSTVQGFISEFFESVGLKEKGRPYRMEWEKVEGAKGRCHVVIEEYTGSDGKPHTANKIRRFLQPEKPKWSGKSWS